jgi:hypothetical protein
MQKMDILMLGKLMPELCELACHLVNLRALPNKGWVRVVKSIDQS